MNTSAIAHTLETLFSELVDGANSPGSAYMLNSGDAGLLRSLALLRADEASESSNGGATIAAHARHLQYGLSLMNRWAREGGDPFADATWDAAWKTSSVSAAEWDEIRQGLQKQAHDWFDTLRTPREVTDIELAGMLGSIAHVAYHLGAIRQITTRGRGPKEGTFSR